MTPETFLETEFDSQLEGRSGAALTRAGEEVVKTCDNAEMQTRWLKMARQLSLPVPRVLSASPEGYRMQFIKGDPAWKSLRSNTVVRMVSYIEFMKGVPALPEFRGSFDSYVQRSVRMLPEDLRGRVVSVSQKWADHCDTQSSFCHGDLTLDNVIDSPTGPVLIDPSIQKDVWSSYLIDVGRMLQSLEWRYEEKYKGAPVDDSKDVWRGYLLDRLDIPRQLGDLMSLLIHCRILHHQYNHSPEDGNRTLATIFEILRRM
jgi:tRNA A-37 threonylcarbamoyl transferase component Bud32